MSRSVAGKRLTDFPEVAVHFDAEKNPLPITSYAAGSNKEVHWKCEQDHEYKRVVVKATSSTKNRCPCCAQSKVSSMYNLAISHPMAHEYHPTKNPLKPEEVMPGSRKLVWWQCSLNPSHEFEQSPDYRRTRQLCPLCTAENNLVTKAPRIAAMWHPTLNKEGPEAYAPKSNKKAYWQCPDDPDHVWQTQISHLTSSKWNGSGCPYCAGQKICYTNSLQHIFPELAKEFDSIKNECTAAEVAKKSSRKFWWVCSVDATHQWESTVAHRSKGRGCPYCTGRKPSANYNLKVLYPRLAEEFDLSLNSRLPEEYTPYSNVRVFWTCKEGHTWDAVINGRSSRGYGCPTCAGYNEGCSNAQILWLDQVASEQSIIIQHARNGGEFYIPKVGHVDGYHPDTNTVYEFHGDFWHGHPKRYNPDDLNTVSNKSFKDLFSQTLLRDRLIFSLGYKLVVRWETEYPEYQKLIYPNKVRIAIQLR